MLAINSIKKQKNFYHILYLRQIDGLEPNVTAITAIAIVGKINYLCCELNSIFWQLGKSKLKKGKSDTERKRKQYISAWYVFCTQNTIWCTSKFDYTLCRDARLGRCLFRVLLFATLLYTLFKSHQGCTPFTH